MSKMFSIVTTIDLNKMREEIEAYKNQTGNHNPYIFMSKSTANAIEHSMSSMIERDKLNNRTKATYDGYNVFINNDLDFGTIEIR